VEDGLASAELLCPSEVIDCFLFCYWFELFFFLAAFEAFGNWASLIEDTGGPLTLSSIGERVEGS
jgi:hypothetical protein